MHVKRKQRLIIVILILVGSAIAIGLALFALQQNINLYYTPTQIAAGKVPIGRVFRIGGIVKKGSVHHEKGLNMNFVLTDKVHNIKVDYDGILPDLFRVGQGIVAQGRLNKHGVFIADQVLAKHGAKYMPPAVIESLKQAQASLKKQKQSKKASHI